MAQIFKDAIEFITAGENLTQNDSVYIDDGSGARTAGRVYKLDMITAGRGIFAGFIKATVTTGNTAKVATVGRMTSFSGLTQGNVLYASVTTPGGYQTTKPVGVGQKIQVLAIAKDATTILMNAALGGSLTEVIAAALGDANTIDLTIADNLVDTSDIDLTGQNADFDGGGTITASSLTISTTAADLLKGEQVIKYTPSANGQNDYFGITRDIPLTYRSRVLGFQFEYKTDSSGADDDFRFAVKIKDGANIDLISYFNLPKQSDNNVGVTAKFTAFIPYDCTQVEIGIQNTSTATTVGFFWDNILITGNPFINKNLLNEQDIRYDGFDSRSGTTVKFKTAQQNKGAAILTVGNTSLTKLTATRDCTVTIITGARALASTIQLNIEVENSGATLVASSKSDAPASNEFTIASLTYAMSTGDYIWVQADADLVDEVDSFISVHAQAEKEAVVHSGELPENNYSARITSADVITSQNIDFLNTVVSSATGIYVITYDTNFFGVTPSVLATAETDGLYCTVTSESVSGCTVNIKSDSGTLTDSDFALHVQRQSSDYKPITGTIITTLTLTAYLKDVKSAGTHGGTFTSGAWRTRDLNTIEGDSSIVSLSVNEFTLDSGKYLVKAIAPSIKTYTTILRVYNVTDAASAINGSSQVNSNEDGTQTEGTAMGIIEISSAKTFRIEHKCTTTIATYGFGVATNLGTEETYTQVEITKLK